MSFVMEYVEKAVKVQEQSPEPDHNLLDELAGLLGSQRFELWFGREATVCVDDGKIVFGLKNRYAVNWIRANFLRDIEQAVLRIFRKPLSIELSILKPNEPAPPVREIPKPSIPVPVSSERPASPLSKTVHFDNSGKIVAPLPGHSRTSASARRFASLQTFVEGLSNRLACRAAELAVHHPGRVNPIYLFGPSSVGKTHLLEGIWSEVRRQHDRKPPLYLTCEQFVSSYLESIQPGSSRSGIQGFRNKFKGISILLVDDIQYLYRKNATQTEFRETLDTLRNQGVQIVLTGDRPLKELTGLRPEILCRLEAGMVCGIEQPERETMLRVFQNMVERRGLPIGPDVCRFVASRLGLHARQLSGALNRLHAVYLATGEPITPESAEKTLGDLIRSCRRSVALPDIEKAVCDTFGLSEQSLQSKSRARQIATPRMLAMWLARKYTRSALSEIGRYFGDRSHSTVVTAQKKVDQWVDENHPVHAESFDVPISEAIRKIEQILQAG